MTTTGKFSIVNPDGISQHDLINACENILGKEVAQAMLDHLGGGLTTILRKSIEKAFMHGASVHDTMVLKSAQHMLDLYGYFQFGDE